MEPWIRSSWHVPGGLGPGTILACFGKSIVVFFDPFGSLLHRVLSWVLLLRYFESIFGQFRLILVGLLGCFFDKLQS